MLFVIVVFIARVLLCYSEPDKRVITSLKYSNYRVQLAVVNGIPANITRVPHLVSIKEPLAKKELLTLWGNLCGASIISKDGRLLTAAHCFEGDKFLYAKRPGLLRAVHGSTRTDITSAGISGISKEGVQWRKLKKAVIHPNFNFPNNDIAVVYVDAPWAFVEGVMPIPIATRTDDELGECYLAGYGRTGHNEMDKTSQVLLIARVETLSRRVCRVLWEMPMDKFICTSSRRSDASEGDSGGPLWCNRRRGTELVGVVSGKNFDTSTIFTRVSEYNNWIQTHNMTAADFKNETTALELSYKFIYAVLFLFARYSAEITMFSY